MEDRNLIGPSSKVFNPGLLILGLNYLKEEKIGIVILLIATLILWHIIPVPFRLDFWYSFTPIGFTVFLFAEDIKNVFQQRAKSIAN